MDLAQTLQLTGDVPFSIDWEITPTYTFTMFESWGGKNGERIRNNDEKFYYFYVDGWEKPFGLYLMERGVKHARIMARIKAPQELIDQCAADEGRSISLDKSYAVNQAMRQWLIENIIDGHNLSLVESLIGEVIREDLTTKLPGKEVVTDDLISRTVRSNPLTFSDDELKEAIVAGKYFDSSTNPEGGVESFLVDNGDALTVTERVTGIMWQRGGCDLTNIHKVKSYVDELNHQKFAGYSDWRLPTIEEAMSLLGKASNPKGLHIDASFSSDQPFIFSADQRRPGGYWFVDFKQGATFWASGTIPGGFGRACRSTV
ncbi:MAG: DUF1566 domain-containing protein [Proteobacteria bacterium]|nr:DUF1566 domain-containing protein [Pseudomonadota bacterium]MBU1688139.1 DUF1566 domain-containing protein [Pseudomonadota bacterium]